MKITISFFFTLLIFLSAVKAQSSTKEEIEFAFTNAQKGIYYSLDNIPINKTRLNEELIEKNKLVAKIKLSKEINGIKVESTGYYLSDEVSIKIYKSYNSLVKEGYIKDAEIYKRE